MTSQSGSQWIPGPENSTSSSSSSPLQRPCLLANATLGGQTTVAGHHVHNIGHPKAIPEILISGPNLSGIPLINRNMRISAFQTKRGGADLPQLSMKLVKTKSTRRRPTLTFGLGGQKAFLIQLAITYRGRYCNLERVSPVEGTRTRKT